MNDALFEIQNAIIEGELTFTQIAARHCITVADVTLIAEELNDQIEQGEPALSDADFYALSEGWDGCYSIEFS